MPLRPRADAWTNTSFPPFSGVMKPKPFWALGTIYRTHHLLPRTRGDPAYTRRRHRHHHRGKADAAVVEAQRSGQAAQAPADRSPAGLSDRVPPAPCTRLPVRECPGPGAPRRSHAGTHRRIRHRVRRNRTLCPYRTISPWPQRRDRSTRSAHEVRVETLHQRSAAVSNRGLPVPAHPRRICASDDPGCASRHASPSCTPS